MNDFQQSYPATMSIRDKEYHDFMLKRWGEIYKISKVVIGHLTIFKYAVSLADMGHDEITPLAGRITHDLYGVGIYPTNGATDIQFDLENYCDIKNKSTVYQGWKNHSYAEHTYKRAYGRVIYEAIGSKSSKENYCLNVHCWKETYDEITNIREIGGGGGLRVKL